ncbi:MAG: hypothetical protein COA69_09620 [Robiginitomaculum sp.]|nr:MAG: hypothetical protein COA69_09620 [Robiginitomaculum sp.]
MISKAWEDALRAEKGMLQHWTSLRDRTDHKTARLTRIIREATEELADVETERLKAPGAVIVFQGNVNRLESRMKRQEALADPKVRRLAKLRREIALLEGDDADTIKRER